MLIELNHKLPAFRDVKFLLRAMGADPKDKRPHMRHCYLENGWINATDGKRLHRITIADRLVIEGLPNKAWLRPLVCKKYQVVFYVDSHLAADFPDVEKISAWADGLPPWINDLDFNSRDRCIACLIRSLPENLTVSYHYISDLGAHWYSVFVQQEVETPMILLKNQTRQAMLMPLRID